MILSRLLINYRITLIIQELKDIFIDDQANFYQNSIILIIIHMRKTLHTPRKQPPKNIFNTDNNPTLYKQNEEKSRSFSKEKIKRPQGLVKQLQLGETKKDPLDPLRSQPKMVRTKSINILKHLDQRDLNFTHKYKQFKSHSKCSGFDEIKYIIEQLLDKHAVERSLTLSQQYILTGYMGKFIELVKPMKNSAYNPFNITKRLQTRNTLQSYDYLEVPVSPKKRSPSKSSKIGNKTVSVVEEKRSTLNKQLARLRFLWQMYRLKCLVCPDLNKICDFNQNDSHHEMMELIAKLKAIERNRAKVGEEKSLLQVQKVMRNFQQTMKKCLC